MQICIAKDIGAHLIKCFLGKSVIWEKNKGSIKVIDFIFIISE
jgi:hypothetical protein